MSQELTKNIGSGSEIVKVATNITLMSQEEVKATVTEYITSPFNVPTPKEKVKKRPDGYDYIESSWMDKGFKTHSPLYDNDLIHYSEDMGWITIIVKITSRITGNSELGGSSVRIQVRQGVTAPSFRDIIDKGNNVAACLSKAIKNAQSRFGHGADIYGKREEIRTEEEITRFDLMLKEIRKISKPRMQLFEDGWKEIGVDFSEYLDKWQIYIDRNTKVLTEENRDSSTSELK